PSRRGWQPAPKFSRTSLRRFPRTSVNPQDQPLKVMKTNMYKPAQLNNATTLSLKHPINWPSLWRVPLIVFVLACLALSPTVRAVDPAPDGGYPNDNTAEGDSALFSLTTGASN